MSAHEQETRTDGHANVQLNIRIELQSLVSFQSRPLADGLATKSVQTKGYAG